MKSLFNRQARPRPLTNEFFNIHPMISGTRLKAPAIVKGKAWVVSGRVFAIDIGCPSSVISNVNVLMRAVINGAEKVREEPCDKLTFGLTLKMLAMREDFPTPVCEHNMINLSNSNGVESAHVPYDQDSKSSQSIDV